MRSMRVLNLALFAISVSASGASAGKPELAAKAEKVVSGLNVAAETSSLKANARKALVKFCKKYEGQSELPARCHKASLALVTE